MTSKQESYYWSLWAKVKAELIKRGTDRKGAEAERHALHVRALGYDKGHKLFSNAEFDLVLGAFKAECDGGDMNAQIRQQAMPQERVLIGIRAALVVLEKGDAYAVAIARKMNVEGAHRAELQLEELSAEVLQTKILVALKQSLRRKWGTKDALIAGVRGWVAGVDLEESECQQVAAGALRRDGVAMESLSYDELLTVWAALRERHGVDTPF